MTRARVAEVAETLHVDEDAVLEIPDEEISHLKPATPPQERSRSPLGELALNSAESKDSEQLAEKSARGRKGGKKAAKGKKKDLSASTASQAEDVQAEDGAQAEGGVELDVSQDGGEIEQAGARAGRCNVGTYGVPRMLTQCSRKHVSNFTARSGLRAAGGS